MNPLALMRRLSTRVHLALGLAAMTVGVLLVASYLQLIPDGEAMVRKQRAATAETIAITASSVMDLQQPEKLADIAGIPDRAQRRIAVDRRAGTRRHIADRHP